jgi:hypothetical protein
MCALCGVLGGDGHWTDAAPRPGIFTRNTGPVERRRERMARVAGANRILKAYGLSLADWQGASYVLSTATGKSELVDTGGQALRSLGSGADRAPVARGRRWLTCLLSRRST